MRTRSLLAALTLLLPGTASAAQRVAMLPIVVHTADTEPGYLSGGLAEMLSSRLEQSGEIRVVRVETERAITRAEPAREAAKDTGAAYVLFGSFTQFGQGASLDVQCAPLAGGDDRDGVPRRVFIQSGSVAEIIPQLDELAEKVRRYVVHGETDEAAAANGAPAGVTAEAYEDLLSRLDALERTVYETPAPTPPATPAQASDESLKGSQAASADGGDDPAAQEASKDAGAVR